MLCVRKMISELWRERKRDVERKVTPLTGRVAVNVTLMLVSLNVAIPELHVHFQSKFSEDPILTYWLNFNQRTYF